MEEGKDYNILTPKNKLEKTEATHFPMIIGGIAIMIMFLGAIFYLNSDEIFGDDPLDLDDNELSLNDQVNIIDKTENNILQANPSIDDNQIETKKEIIDSSDKSSSGSSGSSNNIDKCSTDADCFDSSRCTIDSCTGSPKKCVYERITQCKDYDGCCPDGCDNDNDKDCSSGSSGSSSSKSTSSTDTNKDDDKDDGKIIECDNFEFLTEQENANLCALKRGFLLEDAKFCELMGGEFAVVFEEACLSVIDVNIFKMPIVIEAMYYFDMAVKYNDIETCKQIPPEYDKIVDSCESLLG